MAEREHDHGGAKKQATPLERARANPALREGMLRSIAARLRGEKPVPATELMKRLKDYEVRRHGGGTDV